MESKTTQTRKKRTEEFKREAVRQLEGRGERTIADVAASLGVAENLLHSWKKKYGNAAEQVCREQRLRRENAQLKQERDVLKNR